MALSTKRQASGTSSPSRKGTRRRSSTRPSATRGLGNLLASVFGSDISRATTPAAVAGMSTVVPFMPMSVADITALRNAASIATR
ncbi:MAG: hypothetical protein U0Q11_01855 [Vicinamibacterales bacterium]